MSSPMDASSSAVERCFSSPEIMRKIISNLDNEDLRSLLFVSHSHTESLKELRNRFEASIKFKLGSVDGCVGFLCEQTEFVQITVGGGVYEFDSLLSNIQLTAVGDIPVDIVVADTYRFSPQAVSIISSFQLNVRSFSTNIASLSSLSGPLNFKKIEKLIIEGGGEVDEERTQLMFLLGDCQPVDISITEGYLQETELGHNLKCLKRLKINDSFRDAYNNIQVWLNLLYSKSTLEKLELNKSVAYWIININDLSFAKVTELSIMVDNYSHFRRLSGVFPNVETLELREATSFTTGLRNNILSPVVSVKTLRFNVEGNAFGSTSPCPALRDVFPSVDFVEFTGREYCGEYIHQFFTSNPWARKVKIAGEFCCPETLSPFNFLRLMTDVRDLELIPSLQYSKIEWSSLRELIGSLPHLQSLSMRSVKNVDLSDLDRLGTLILTNCSILNAQPHIYPCFVNCKFK